METTGGARYADSQEDIIGALFRQVKNNFVKLKNTFVKFN